MAKDKNRGEPVRANSAKDEAREKSIDATSGSESDSELDIHALLRKYMPDYDSDDTDEDSSGGILQQLKQSRDSNGSTDTAQPTADSTAEDTSVSSPAFDLDSAFQPSTDKKYTKAGDAAEYEFTSEADSPAEEDNTYMLEDDEGIYEDDIPRQKKLKKDKKTKHGLFAKREKPGKAEKSAEDDLHVLPPEDLFTNEAAEPYIPVRPVSMEIIGEDGGIDTEESDTSTVQQNARFGKAVMDSMDIPETQTDDKPDMPHTQTLKPDSSTAEEEPFDGIDLDAIAASLSFADDGNKTDTGAASQDLPNAGEESNRNNTADLGSEPSTGDDSFDPTDINLMVAFGMDEDDKTAKGKKKNRSVKNETREQKAARQAGDRLEAEQSGPHKVKLDYPEYMDRSQTPEIQKRYRYELTALWIKFGLCGVFTILLMLFENMEVLSKLFTGTAKQFGGVFDPAVYPVVYAMVSLQLMLLACVFAWEQIYDGLRSLFRTTPKPESLTALLALAGILYTIIIARITNQSDEPVMFNFIVAFAAWMTIGGAIYNKKREILGFQVVSSPKPKHIVCRVSDEESRCETNAFAEDDSICDVMRIEKTDFVDGFFTRLNTPDSTTNLFMSCAMGIVVALSVLFGVFTGVNGGNGIEIARVVIISLVTVAPLSVFLGFSYPFWRASVAARDFDSAIIGEASLSEYANASIVTFDDKNVFPSYSVKVQNIRIYNNARIDRVIYYAASVFSAAGGPLQDVFEIATLEMGHSENVNIFDTDRGFLAAEVDGVNILLGSAKSLAERGLTIPREVFDEDADMSDELSIMYMFREDRLVAKMYIQYVMDGDIELILGQFQNSGLYVCVRTFDPNIDERMIARKVNMKRIPLKVVRYASGENETVEKASSGLVTCGSPKSLLQVISYCDKVLHTKKTNIALYVLAMLIGAAIMTLLVLSGSVSVMTSLYIAVYQLLWLIPMLLASKMFIR